MDRKHLLLILATINFSHIVDSMLIMPLGDIFISEFGITASEYSLLVSAYAIAASISSFIGIFYLDLYNRKTALLIMYSGFAIGTFACGFANSYHLLLILRFCTGFFGGMIGALVLSIVSDLYLFKERGQAMGVLMGAFSAASALGIPIGLFLAAKGHWQLPFYVIGILGLVISIFIYFKFPSMDKHLKLKDEKNSHLQTIKNITSDSNQLKALFAGFVLILGHFLIIPFISPYFIKNVGMSQLEISYQFFFGGVATVVSAYIIGKMTDKHGVMPIFSIMMFLTFIPVYLITNMQFSPIWYPVAISTLFFITASGRMIPANTIITAAAPPSNRGSFMSLKSSLQQLAIALAAILSGFVVNIDESSGLYVNYDKVGYLSILIGLGTIFLLSIIKVAKGN